MTASKIVAAAASGVGGAGLDVDEVFNTFNYTGTGTARSITNGIDFSGEGGMLWIKDRENSGPHVICTTDFGDTHYMTLNSVGGSGARATNYGMTSFNSDGFSLGLDYEGENGNGERHVAFSFRKAKNFFDTVTWSGDGVNNRSISHNLGSKPGAILMKCTGGGSENWYIGCWNGMPHNNGWKLNTGEATSTYGYFGTTAPTATTFNVTSFNGGNASGRTYVAYLFAHHNGDGVFGPNGDQDIIKFGSYTGAGSANGPDINLGFEPQWVMIKNATASSGNADWNMFDNMRGLRSWLQANQQQAEDRGAGSDYIDYNADGFTVNRDDIGVSGQTYIYMAIRRGPLNEPDDATKVFNVSTSTNSNVIPTGFNVDFNLNTLTNSQGFYVLSRLMGELTVEFTQSPEGDQGNVRFFDDLSNHINLSTAWWGTNANTISWSWGRAPKYFDVVTYQGTGNAGFAFTHNLGVKPEMIWVKSRGASEHWAVYHKGLNGGTNPSHYYLKLNTNDSEANYNEIWNDTEPTATQVTVGQQGMVNNGSFKHIACLFATVEGVSKVGSYTGDGTSNGRTIDCGFSSGARFVLIKRRDQSDHWYVWDTARGIVNSADPYLKFDSGGAQVTDADWIDPQASGFSIRAGQINGNGQEFIFYAVA